MITIKKPEDMEKYYDKETNTYRFVDKNGFREDVTIKFNINIDSNIYAWNINAWNINAWNINAGNINAWNINAVDINAWNINAGDITAGDINAGDINADHILYYAVCIAYESFKCKSVKGRRINAVHMCLDGDIEYKGGDGE
ncbi:MAG: hypothetical protein HFI90_06895 [Clostridia bacterium]|nr:hypothetical protein [Clostridia bacterium]